MPVELIFLKCHHPAMPCDATDWSLRDSARQNRTVNTVKYIMKVSILHPVDCMTRGVCVIKKSIESTTLLHGLTNMTWHSVLLVN